MTPMTAPEEIHHVSQSQFSVARHYGGCTYMGQSYIYDAGQDRLIRRDVYLASLKQGKAEAKALRDAERQRWTAAQNTLI